MDQFLSDIMSYSAACGVQPTTVLQRAVGASGTVWQRWLDGGSCSMRTADRIRAYMADNPPKTAGVAA